VTAPAKPVPTLPGPYSIDEVIDRFEMVAASQIGYREGKSGGSWNNDTVYGAWYGKGFNYAAWCASFVSWCADKAGILGNVIPKHAYTPSGFAWFKARGQVGGRVPPVGKAATGLGRPKRGDIMYVHGLVSGAWRIHHVGIVENVLPGGYIQTIEGNTNTTGSASGDGTYRLKRKVTSRLFFASPNYAAAVKPRPKPAPGAPPAKPADVDSHGQPRTGGRPKVDAQGKQILDLGVLTAGAKLTGTPTYTAWAQMAAVWGSFKHPSLNLAPKAQPLTGPNFKTAWAKWQRKLGYTGKDADGIPGTASFSRLIERTGRSKKSSGYKAK
jgi:hypothetical protein